MAHALRFLRVAERTEAELRKHLAGKQVSEPDIDRVVALCSARKFVSDLRVSDRQTEMAKSSRPVGREKLRAKLEHRGISEETVDKSLGDYSEAEEAEGALAWIRSRKLTDPGKAARSLVARGFGEEAVRSAMARAFPELDL